MFIYMYIYIFDKHVKSHFIEIRQQPSPKSHPKKKSLCCSASNKKLYITNTTRIYSTTFSQSPLRLCCCWQSWQITVISVFLIFVFLVVFLMLFWVIFIYFLGYRLGETQGKQAAVRFSVAGRQWTNRRRKSGQGGDRERKERERDSWRWMRGKNEGEKRE